jgi:uncharacterized membrane protein
MVVVCCHTSGALVYFRDFMGWLNVMYIKTWKNNPQNVYNLVAIATACLVLFVSIRLGISYLRYSELTDQLNDL